MLKLINIKKDYKLKGVPTVHALKGINLNFRRNEFVAILGPSGCGKTTLLNITGGLDRYSSGDLIIEGKSTKHYKDADWDTYRNHSIGFIFQSYNLIMHQTLLKNVELALTISGVSKEERKLRAYKALEEVGLKGFEKKKPNQLSGGQMQRVAIARALINNPEIVLADEPTGALDSETSIQIMNLLKEVAKDRLVIMVTHNPELAYEYASRIVKMKDGVVLEDSKPYEGETKAELSNALATKVQAKINKGKKTRSSMSFVTAGSLSVSNLISKMRRSVLIAIAGSIGIMGVSAVLAVKFGVDNFIDKMQEDMLSQYPIEITETAVDYASLMSGLSNWEKKDLPIDLNDSVGVDSMIDYLMEKYQDFTSVKTNDINNDLLNYINNMSDEHVSSINYNYGLDITNNLFTTWKKDSSSSEIEVSLSGLTKMYISELTTVSGFGEYAMFVDLFTNFMKQLPGNESFINSQYDCLAGHFPRNENELMVVVDDNTTLTDILFAQMGYFTQDEFINLATYAIKENEGVSATELKKYDYPDRFSYEEILSKELTFYNTNKLYNEGVFYTGEYQNYSMTFLTPGVPDPTLTNFDVIYDIKKDSMLASIPYNGSDYDLTFLRKGDMVDPTKPEVGEWSNSFADITVFDSPKTTMFFDNPVPNCCGTMTIKVIEGMENLPLPITQISKGEYQELPLSGYYYNAMKTTSDDYGTAKQVKISGIYRKKNGVNFGCLSRGIYYNSKLADAMMDGCNNSAMISKLENIIKTNGDIFSPYLIYKYTSFVKPEGDEGNNEGYASAINGGLSVGSMFGGGSSNSAKDYNKATLRKLSGLATKEYLEGTETKFSFERLPSSISIYPRNFESKNYVTDYLDKWNEDISLTFSDQTNHNITLQSSQREELTYSDTIQMIVTLIKTLIDAIAIALIVFTSLSLVVSCFMIAVITYISTMERVKEIGVIRSLGGRKKDVSRLFITECLIIGLASGLIGTAFAYLISAIVNAIVGPMGVENIAALPIWMAGIMILLSIVLNVLSGLIPSMKASKQDPVIALRSE